MEVLIDFVVFLCIMLFLYTGGNGSVKPGLTMQPINKLSKFLKIPDPPGGKKKSSINSGACVLTSIECMQMLEEKEKKKREAAEEKETRKAEREERRKAKQLEKASKAHRKRGE